MLCVCCLPIYSGRQACGRTSGGHIGRRPHRILNPPSFCGACLNFSRDKDSTVTFLSLVDRGVGFLCTNELIVLHLLDSQCNGRFFPDIILLTLFTTLILVLGNPFNPIKLSLQPTFPPKRFDIFPSLLSGCPIILILIGRF